MHPEKEFCPNSKTLSGRITFSIAQLEKQFAGIFATPLSIVIFDKLEHIKEKTKLRQEKNKWEFVFMGANQDAWAAGGAMGIANNVNYTVNDTERAFTGAAYYTMNSRTYSKKMSLDNFDLTQEELNIELTKVKKNKISKA